MIKWYEWFFIALAGLIMAAGLFGAFLNGGTP